MVQGFGGTGIGGFEFAGSSSHAAQIMAEWGTEGRRLAHLGLLLDYGYIPARGWMGDPSSRRRSCRRHPPQLRRSSRAINRAIRRASRRIPDSSPDSGSR